MHVYEDMGNHDYLLFYGGVSVNTLFILYLFFFSAVLCIVVEKKKRY